MARAFGKGELNEAGRISLRHIGRMMAFDILIFNYDRLPCVFQNGGNTENVMIADDGSVVAIDSMISGFDISNPAAREQFEAFLKRVGALVASTLAAPTTPLAEFSAVRELLLKGRGDESSEAYCPPLAYDIGDEGVREIQSGFLSCLRDFDQLPAHAFEQLPRLVQAFLGEDGCARRPRASAPTAFPRRASARLTAIAPLASLPRWRRPVRPRVPRLDCQGLPEARQGRRRRRHWRRGHALGWDAHPLR